MNIRPLEAGDLEEALRIERESFPDPWSEQSLEGGFGAPWQYALAAEGEEGLLGYLFAITAADEGELINIAVKKEARGEGLGGALIMRMFADHPEVTIWRLDVRTGNAPAISLYERLGFQAVCRNKNYYTDPPEDGFLMIKTRQEALPPA